MAKGVPAAARMRKRAAALLRAALLPALLVLRMTREGWALILAALVFGAVSVRVGNVPLLIALVMAAMVFLGALLGWLCLRGISLRRYAPDRAFAGDRIRISLAVSNRLALPAGALLIEEGLTDEAVRRGIAFAAVVPGGGMERARYEMRVRRRGVYRFRPTLIHTTFPFGMFATAIQRQAPGKLVVYPRLGEIDRDFYVEMERAMMCMIRTRPSREEDDFRGLREYRRGDNPRWIHWRSSARLGKPLVREFERPETRRVVVCLDTCTQRLGVRSEAQLEQAISFAGTFARDCIRLGHDVDVAAFIPRLTQLRLSLERRNIEILLERLAELKPAPEKNLRHLFDAMDREVLCRAYVVLVALGSARLDLDLSRYKTPDNEVRLLEVGSDDFRRLFRRVARDDREGVDEDLFADRTEPAEEEAELPLVE